MSAILWAILGGAIAALVAFLGGYGVGRRKDALLVGNLQSEVSHTKGERDAAIEVAETRGSPLETPEERQASARAELLRRGIRLSEAGDGDGAGLRLPE